MIMDYNSIVRLVISGFFCFIIILPLGLHLIIEPILRHKQKENDLKIELAKLELEKAKLNKDRVVLPKNNPGEWSSYHEYK